MQTLLDWFGRWVAGPLCVLIGLGMMAVLYFVAQLPTKDVFHLIGVLIGVELYSVVAVLFVLVGLRYTLGPQSWIDRLITDSNSRLIGVSVICSLAVTLVILIVLL